MQNGITPAPAGNTLPGPEGPVALRDHPRACGKHTERACLTVARWGSPPRLRETQDFNKLEEAEHGITPAPAGNTEQRLDGWALNWDHPRACGKHLGGAGSVPCRPGSPPRLRETPFTAGVGSFQHGITPAPAGNTNPSRWNYYWS